MPTYTQALAKLSPERFFGTYACEVVLFLRKSFAKEATFRPSEGSTSCGRPHCLPFGDGSTRGGFIFVRSKSQK